MEKSGFVGHLLENKSTDGFFQAMRHFCTVMFCNMDEKLIHKSSGYWRFDQFFSSVPINVESFGKFVCGVLRRPDADLVQLQLQIERIVWDLIKCDYVGLADSGGLDSVGLFRLFCLFNRFCRRDVIPMTLHSRAAVFLCKELGLPSTVDPAPSFRGLAKHVAVFSKIVPGTARAVKRLYDEFVRDVIKEGKVQFRVIDDTFGTIVNASKIKTQAVTSRHLIIYEDADFCEDTDTDCKVLHKIPLIAVGTRTVSGLFGKSKMYLQLLSKSRAYPSIELAFAADKDSFDLFSWNQAIQEAVFRTRINATSLTKAYSKLGIGESSGPAACLSKNRHSSVSVDSAMTAVVESPAELDVCNERQPQPRERFYSSGDLTKVESATKLKSKPPPPSPPSGDVSPLLRRTLLRMQDNDGSLAAKNGNDTMWAKGKFGDSNASRRP